MPEAEDGGMRLVTVDDYLELGFKEAVHWRNDNVKGKDDKIIFLSSPLKVMLRPDLDGSGMSEGGGNDGFVVHDMEQLGRFEAFVLKGSQLSIGPPVLVPRHYFQKSGGIGREGTGCEL